MYLFKIFFAFTMKPSHTQAVAVSSTPEASMDSDSACQACRLDCHSCKSLLGKAVYVYQTKARVYLRRIHAQEVRWVVAEVLLRSFHHCICNLSPRNFSLPVITALSLTEVNFRLLSTAFFVLRERERGWVAPVSPNRFQCG